MMARLKVSPAFAPAPQGLSDILGFSYQRIQKRIKPCARNPPAGLTKHDPSAKGSSVSKMKAKPCDIPEAGGGRQIEAVISMQPQTEP
jgi:hypothetical protein